ncbi:immunoglobulin-like domain-containing receptor 2 isoform X3 [Manis pentadactyla]|uniref:immunoglobulin-like domain-containing receptor 2 isoform X3 n=1 Tax=Manis pentadactyla TaxID=143292 RepID=UPI00255CDA4C|nr:immunoglobulin-like domain-containing receptor 2 isoform X3 [Manis pentadactyla]
MGRVPGTAPCTPPSVGLHAYARRQGRAAASGAPRCAASVTSVQPHAFPSQRAGRPPSASERFHPRKLARGTPAASPGPRARGSRAVRKGPRRRGGGAARADAPPAGVAAAAGAPGRRLRGCGAGSDPASPRRPARARASALSPRRGRRHVTGKLRRPADGGGRARGPESPPSAARGRGLRLPQAAPGGAGDPLARAAASRRRLGLGLGGADPPSAPPAAVPAARSARQVGDMHRAVLACVAVSWLTAMAKGLQVTVPDKKKVAMLFQPAVLRCHYATSSHQPAVVQWKFKSYCQDRMGESLGMSSSRAQALSKRNLEWDPYLDCLDSRRTVRVVASKQGSTITLGDFYRGREITIVHDADLQIGKLLWGDSGLYYCIVTTPDDLEGKNEESVELLVLGRTGLLADLLPSFAVEIMPEWVFVGLVILGVALLFVLLGICWCQCCPHSCCCYVRCPCCPDSCCCPQAFRKGYRIQADKERDSMKVLYYVEKELAQFDPARRMRSRYNNTISELSSLHEEDSGFRQSYHQMRSKQFPMPGELECDPEYWSGVMGGSSGASRGPSVMDYDKEDRESFRHSQPRSKSEMLSRKNFAAGIPAVSMDELAALADPFGPRARRADGNGHEARGAARFERPEARAPAGFYPGSPEGRPGPRGRREPPGADRWGPSPARRRPEDAPLPRLVSRTPGAAGALEASLRAGPPEGASRGGSLETPGRRGARGAAFLGWAPPAALDAGPGDAAAADALPPYSEREPGRRPSLRSREPPVPGAADPRRRKDAARKASDFPTRMSLVV